MAASVRSRLSRGIPGKANKGSWFDSSTASFTRSFYVLPKVTFIIAHSDIKHQT